MITFDVNVMVAAFRSDHPFHGQARSWLETAISGAQPKSPLFVLPMVAASFIRLVTHESIFPDATPIDAATKFLVSLMEIEGVRWAGLGDEWPVFVELSRKHQLRGNAIPDAWIAAAVKTRGLNLATFDRDFKRYLLPAELTLLPSPSSPTV